MYLLSTRSYTKPDCLYSHGNEMGDSFLDDYSRNLQSYVSQVLHESSKMWSAVGIRSRSYGIDFRSRNWTSQTFQTLTCLPPGEYRSYRVSTCPCLRFYNNHITLIDKLRRGSIAYLLSLSITLHRDRKRKARKILRVLRTSAMVLVFYHI